MRDYIGADWAFGIRGAIENIVREAFPTDLRNWPLLQTFNFEAYHIDGNYLIMVLRDKLSGVPVGGGRPKPLPYDDHPALPPSAQDAKIWHTYLSTKFSLREEDAGLIVPLRDSGKGAPEDYALFFENEKELWDSQMLLIVARHKAKISKPLHSIPFVPATITYNVSGTNARVNINSTDVSRNVVRQEIPEIFSQLRDLIEKSVRDLGERDRIVRTVDEMEAAYGSVHFLNAYQKFMAISANHMTVLAQLLPTLAELLT